MILALLVEMILKQLNIFLQHVHLCWVSGIKLAFTFIILPPRDLDSMYLILFGECPFQETEKVLIF